jgi:thioredoxin reductase (NADPH)
MATVIYDSLIIGGGPAGFTAAIYLTRFNRSVLVIDKGHGRCMTHEVNENYFGFPKGIPVQELLARGKKQAEHYGAKIVNDQIIEVSKSSYFEAKGEKKTYMGKTMLFATGVQDNYPQCGPLEDYIGRSVFWCITCDGYKTRGKTVTIIGNGDEAATTALQFMNFTDKIQIVTNCAKERVCISPKKKKHLEKAGIPIFVSELEKISGSNGVIRYLQLGNGEKIRTNFMFNLQPSTPHSNLAQSLGVLCDESGYIMVGDEQRTQIEGIYAAGDVTKHFSHQILSAAHEGSMAGQAINYDLYNPEQRG